MLNYFSGPSISIITLRLQTDAGTYLFFNKITGIETTIKKFHNVSYLVEMRSVVDVRLKTVELYREPRVRVGEVLRHVLRHVATPPSTHQTPKGNYY
jgi:hypothetical protein